MVVDASPARPGRRGADLLCAALLLLAVAGFFWPVLFGGKSFFFRDTSTIYLSQATLTVEAWKQGRLPLWEPTIAFGYPFQADPHSMVFYPPALVMLLLPMPRAYDLFVVMHVALTGLFTFLLFRRWGLARTSAVTGALLTMFCGYTVSATYLTTLLKGTTWTPLALLAFDCFLVGGRWRALLATALVLAVEGSGTDPQYVLFTIAMLAALPWLAPRLPRPPVARAACGLATAVLLAGALLAYQYLPLLELIRNSERSATVNLSEGMAYEVGPGALLNLAVPLAFPDVRDRFFLLSYPGRSVPLYLDLYWGIPVFALALCALGWRRARRPGSKPSEGAAFEAARLGEAGPPEVPFESERAAALGSAALAALVLAGVGLALSVGDRAPFYPALSTWLPVLRFFRYPCKHILLTAFALPLAAAIGVEGLLRGQADCLSRCLGLFRWAAALAVPALAGLQLCGSWPATTFLDVPWSSDPIVLEALAVFKATWVRGLLALLVLTGAGWALAAVAVRGPRRWPVRALAGLAAAQMMWFTFASLPVARDEVLGRRTETGRILRSGLPATPNAAVPPRFMALDEGQITIGVTRTDDDLVAETEKMIGLTGCVNGCNNVMGSMSVHLAGFLALLDFADHASRADQARLAGALGATHQLYVPKDSDQQAPEGEFAGKVLMARTPKVTPRAYIAPRAVARSAGSGPSVTAAVLALPGEAAYDPADARGPEGLTRSSEDPRENGSLEVAWGQPNPGAGVFQPRTPRPRLRLGLVLEPKAIARCELVEYRADRLKVEFDLRGQGLLVVQDSFYPGWHALVDGQERPIVRVAGLFRGVPVREGERVLQMFYRPRPFWTGAAISLTALALLLLGLVRAGTAQAFAGNQGIRAVEWLSGFATRMGASSTAWLALLWLALGAGFWPVLVGTRAIWFRDVFELTLPIANALGAAWRAGELGLWQPGLAMGYPLLAEPAAMTLYPPGFLLAWHPVPWMLGLFAALHLGLAASGTFLLLRSWGLGRPAAAFGGAVLMFSGVAAGSTSLASATRVLAWLPWVLLGVERFLASGSSRPLAGGAVALALMALSTDHASVILTAGLAVALPWFRPCAAGLPPGRVAAGLGLCLGLAFGLAAMALLPAIEFGVLGGWNRLASSESYSPPPGPLDLLNLFVPRPFQDPQSPYFLGGFRDWRLPFHVDLYLGIGVLALALAGMARGSRGSAPSDAHEPSPAGGRSGRLGGLAVAGVLLSVLPACGGEAWMAGHPELTRFAARLVLPVMLALALLAAQGLERVASGQRRSLLLAAVGAALLACLTTVVLAGFFGHGTELLRAYLLSPAVGLAEGVDGLLANLRDAAIRHIERVWAFSLALVTLAWAGFRGRISGRAVAVAVGLLTLGDLAFNTHRGLATVEAGSVPAGSRTGGAIAEATDGTPRARYLTYPLNETVVSSEENALVKARLANDVATGNRGLLFGLHSLLDFSVPSSPAHLALVGLFREADGREARDRLAGALGAAAAVSAEGMGNATGSGPVLIAAGPVVVRRIPRVAPRAFIAPRAVPAAPGATLPTAAALAGLRTEAVYEIPGTGAPLVPARAGGCRVVSHGWDRVEVEFELEGAGLLVLLDGWSTGWKARVDGAERPVARVAGLFRGVAVNGGEHRLVLTFEPVSFRLGLALGVLSLGLLLGLVLRGRRLPSV